MAIVKCRECGAPVSTEATTCPHCGAPRKAVSKGVSPWTIIGWILLAFFVLVIYGCYQTFKPGGPLSNTGPLDANLQPTPRPTVNYVVSLDSWTCEERHGYTIAKIAIQNKTSVPLEFAKAYFVIGGVTEETYLHPTTIPSGAMATAESMRQVVAAECVLKGIQGRNGEPVRIIE